MIAHHLGTLHAYEQVLALVLAFGPFVVLAIVIFVRRRQDAADPTNGQSARSGRPRSRP